MNRIQKKCFFGAASLHGLLIAIMFVSPAFVSAPPKTEGRPLLETIPSKTLDQLLSGGGNPNSGASSPVPPPAPAPAPQPPTPQPRQPDPIPEPAKPKPVERQKPVETAKPVEKDPDPDGIPAKPTKPVKRTLPDISLKPVVRKTDNNAAAREAAARDAENKRIAAENRERREVADRIGNTVASLRNRVGSGSVDMPKFTDGPSGPGGGGPSYANFDDALRLIYTRAWIIPDNVTDDQATAVASITIAKDGRVLDARIIRSSGNALADQSIRAALKRVTQAVPLPEGTKESQRTVTINFNVKAKRGLG